MKRSEAINQLAGYLSTYSDYENTNPIELQDLANFIIQGVVKLGMRPPDRDPTTLCGNYTWEPENEKD